MVPISVCIPVYNGEDYLKECLNSVINQSFRNFEVIVVDDQSSDASFEIARKYGDQDDRVRIFQNEQNLNLVNNWNRCIELSRGEWIKFVFQDDLIELDCLEKMMKFAMLERSMIVCRRKIIFDNVSHIIKRTFDQYSRQMSIDSVLQGQSDIGPNDFCNAVLDNLGYNFIGEPTSVMVHRSAFDKVGRFNSEFIQLSDLELFSRIGCNFGLRYIPETLATFRVHSKAMSLISRDTQKLRMESCDLLLLYHEFVYNPIFQQMRDIASHRRPEFNLKRFLVFEGIRARAIAKSLHRKSLGAASSPIDELNSFLKDHPAIDNIPTSKWLELLGPFIQNRRIFMFLYKHIIGKISL
ncbi:MAG: glycosyltransferase family 2 protein [Nitrospinales bacterium]|jgi:glycosyltransferase involved in cell wall biosynthesis